MKKKSLDRYLFISLGVLAIFATAYALRLKPVTVDVAAAKLGDVDVTIDASAQTRVKESYIVAAPISGQTQRIDIHPGDAVKAGETLITRIEPSDPVLLDQRSKSEAQARVKAAHAAKQQAVANLARIMATVDYMVREFKRAEELLASGSIAQQELEEAALKKRTAEAEASSARFAIKVAEYELETAEAVLSRKASGTVKELGFNGIEVKAPINGIVLRVFQENASPIQAGAPLVEIGDPESLEVIADVLSSAAIKIRAGMDVILENWGGDKPLRGHVRTVEPAAFTKVSALGVEEQRVNVLISIDSPFEERASLGVGFQVDTRIVIARNPGVLTVPATALIRNRDGFAVYKVTGGKARHSPVNIGHDNGQSVEILSGVALGEVVVVHPSDRVAEGVRVAAVDD